MPAALLIPAIIGAGSSIASAKIQSGAAKKAGSRLSSAAERAAALQKQAADTNISGFTAAQQAARGTYDPYTAVGRQGAGLLGAYTGPGQFTPTTQADMANDPSYAWRVAQGQQGLERSAAARGTLLTGGTAKALERYRQGEASQEFGNIDQRRRTDFLTNEGQRQQGFQNSMGMMDFGYGAQQGRNASDQWYMGNIANQRNIGAGYQAGGVTDAANAMAAGNVGSANAWGGAFSNIGNNAQQMAMLWQYLQQHGAAPPGSAASTGGTAPTGGTMAGQGIYPGLSWRNYQRER